MDPLIRQILDIEKIKVLKAQYCLAVSTKNWKLFFELFDDNLVFIQPNGITYTSKDDFYRDHKANIQDTDAWGSIACSTPIITITSDNTASGVWAVDDYHVFPHDTSLNYHGFGHYYEEYIRNADGWRFKQIKPIYHRNDPYEIERK